MDDGVGEEMDGEWMMMQVRRWMVMDGDAGKEMDGEWMMV